VSVDVGRIHVVSSAGGAESVPMIQINELFIFTELLARNVVGAFDMGGRCAYKIEGANK
jgi:hypothetical protein